jgi:hypothetical protein
MSQLRLCFTLSWSSQTGSTLVLPFLESCGLMLEVRWHQIRDILYTLGRREAEKHEWYLFSQALKLIIEFQDYDRHHTNMVLVHH